MPLDTLTVYFQGKDEGLKREFTKVAAKVREGKAELEQLRDEFRNSSVASDAFGNSIRYSRREINALNNTLKKNSGNSEEFRKAFGRNFATTIEKLGPQLRKAERQLNMLASGGVKTADQASQMAHDFDVLAGKLPDIVVQGDEGAIALGQLSEGLDGASSRLKEHARELGDTADANKLMVEQTRVANAQLGFLGLERGPEATNALNILGSAAAGTMLAMGLMRKSFLQVGFSLIFAKFSMVPVLALTAGLTLGVSKMYEELNKIVERKKTVERFSSQMLFLGQANEVTANQIRLVDSVLSKFDNSVRNSDVHVQDLFKSIAMFTAQGVTPLEGELEAIVKIAFATGQSFEDVTKQILTAVDPGAFTVGGIEGFRKLLDPIFPFAIRIGFEGDNIDALLKDVELYADISGDAISNSERIKTLIGFITENWEKLGNVREPFIDTDTGGIVGWLKDAFGLGSAANQDFRGINDALNLLNHYVKDDTESMLILHNVLSRFNMRNFASGVDALRKSFKGLGLELSETNAENMLIEFLGQVTGLAALKDQSIWTQIRERLIGDKSLIQASNWSEVYSAFFEGSSIGEVGVDFEFDKASVATAINSLSVLLRGHVQTLQFRGEIDPDEAANMLATLPEGNTKRLFQNVLMDAGAGEALSIKTAFKLAQTWDEFYNTLSAQQKGVFDSIFQGGPDAALAVKTAFEQAQTWDEFYALLDPKHQTLIDSVFGKDDAILGFKAALELAQTWDEFLALLSPEHRAILDSIFEEDKNLKSYIEMLLRNEDGLSKAVDTLIGIQEAKSIRIPIYTYKAGDWDDDWDETNVRPPPPPYGGPSEEEDEGSFFGGPTPPPPPKPPPGYRVDSRGILVPIIETVPTPTMITDDDDNSEPATIWQTPTYLEDLEDEAFFNEGHSGGIITKGGLINTLPGELIGFPDMLSDMLGGGDTIHITIDARGATFLDRDAPKELVDAVSNAITKQMDVRSKVTINRR